MRALSTARPAPGLVRGDTRDLRGGRTGPVFVFSGQGSQWAGMALGLGASPVFAEAFAECGEALAPG